MLRGALAAAILAAPVLPAGAARNHVVCPRGSDSPDCEYTGNDAIQQAVDRASAGDTVQVRAGAYAPEHYRDVAFQGLLIRGYVVVEQRDLRIVGELGAVLDGSTGPPTSAIVVRGGHVTIRNLTLRGFRAADPTDDIYDGHGLFVIDAEATLEHLAFEKLAKMALTVRGNGVVSARDIRILDGHVGIWLEEHARLQLRYALVRNNESAGFCAYGDSSASIERALFELNRDDGIYTEGRASVTVTRSTIVSNDPYGLHAAGRSRIRVDHVALAGNVRAATGADQQGNVSVGAGVLAYGPASL